MVEVVREAYPDPTAESGDWVVRGHEGGGADAEAGDAGRDQGRPEAGGLRAGPAVAAFGDAGVEAALGPDLPDGRMEGLIPRPAARSVSASTTSPDGGSKGFPPPPGGFTGLFAVRQGDAVLRLRECLPAYRHAAGLDARPLPLARRQPYRLRHPRRRVPHRRRAVPAWPLLRRSAGAGHDPDQGRHYLRAGRCRVCEPASHQGTEQVRCQTVHAADAQLFPVKPEIAAPGRMSPPRAIRTCSSAPRAIPNGFWAEQAQPHRLDEAADQDQEHQLRRRRLDQMVRGRHAERLGVLPRPAPGDARRPDRDHLGKRRPDASASTSPIASCTSRSAGWPMR